MKSRFLWKPGNQVYLDSSLIFLIDSSLMPELAGHPMASPKFLFFLEHMFSPTWVVVCLRGTADKETLNSCYTRFFANLSRILFVELGIGMGGTPWPLPKSRQVESHSFFVEKASSESTWGHPMASPEIAPSRIVFLFRRKGEFGIDMGAPLRVW